MNVLADKGIVGQAVPFEEKILNVGRYAELMRSKLTIQIQQKTTLIFFTCSQILTEFLELNPSDVSVVLHFMALFQSFLQAKPKVSNVERLDHGSACK